MRMGSPEDSRPFLSLEMGQKNPKNKKKREKNIYIFDLQWEGEQGMNALIQLQLTRAPP